MLPAYVSGGEGLNSTKAPTSADTVQNSSSGELTSVFNHALQLRGGYTPGVVHSSEYADDYEYDPNIKRCTIL